MWNTGERIAFRATVFRGFPSTSAGTRALTQAVENFLVIVQRDRTACPARSNKLLPEPGRPFRRVCYLRAAQAYMLISMPTGTSTIFGVFQLMRVSQAVFGTTFVPAAKLGGPRT